MRLFSSYEIILFLLFPLLAFGQQNPSHKFSLTISEQIFPNSDPTDRQPTFLKSTDFFTSNGYISSVLSNTPTSNDSNPPLPTKQNFREAASQIISNAKSGDQVVFNILTHGGPQDSNGKEHDLLLADGPMPISELATVIKKLEAKGVKIAIIDQSCFSGVTLDLASQNTCVISAASRDSVGYITFNDLLWSNARKGESIEDVFLKSRRIDRSLAYPMISTEEGEQTSAALKHLTDFSLITEPDQVPGTWLASKPLIQCEGFGSVIAPIQQLSRSLNVPLDQALRIPSVKRLNELGVEYRELLEQAPAYPPEISSEAFHKLARETIKVDGDNVSLMQLASNDYEDMLQKIQVLKKAPGLTENQIEQWSDQEKQFRKLYFIQKELVKSRPDFAQYMIGHNIKIVKERVDARKKWDENSGNKIKNIQQKLVAQERTAFSNLYEAAKHQNTNSPCRQITF